MKLAKNMGTTDRIIRFVLAAIFAALYFTGTVSGTFGIILLGAGSGLCADRHSDLLPTLPAIWFVYAYKISNRVTCPLRQDH